jgi:CelD/BcsL family acetyltransferase involved in cellulose biosynthesis
MNVLALRPSRPDIRGLLASDRRIVRLEVYEDMAAVEPHWRALEAAGGLSTPYQRFEFLRLWQQHIGSARGITPFIAVGFDAQGVPLCLWPFGRRRLLGMRVIEFLGGKHANFNMGLWRCGVAGNIGASDVRKLIARLSPRADLLRLINQPLTWTGATNPFALLPHQHSADFGFSGALIPDFDALLRARTNAAARKKMRKKEQALAAFGSVRFTRAATPVEARHLLDTFFKQKSVRMRAVGVSDVFAAAGVRRFIEAAALDGLVQGAPLVELYALSVDDIPVATMGGIVGGGRFCAMFNSIAQGRYTTESPGEQLIVHLVRQCCERGLDTFDLGIGEARYKGLFCGDAEPLFDSFLPLNAKGRLLAVLLRGVGAAKRALKQQPYLWALVRNARRLKARLHS